MTFSIKFLDTPVPLDRLASGEQAESGEIEINDHKERIIIPTNFWSRENYQQQWIDAVEKIINDVGDPKTALITEMYDPDTANFIKCWPMYRVSDQVFLQNKIIFFDTISKPFMIEKIGDYIGDRSTQNERGDQISEWNISVSDIVEWKNHLNQD